MKTMSSMGTAVVILVAACAPPYSNGDLLGARESEDSDGSDASSSTKSSPMDEDDEDIDDPHVPPSKDAGTGQPPRQDPPNQDPPNQDPPNQDPPKPEPPKPEPPREEPPLSCASTNSCGGAADLGTLRGDTGQDVQQVQGTTSRWFTLRTTEDNGAFLGWPMSITADLRSPAGTRFDLFIYVPAAKGALACNAGQRAVDVGQDTCRASAGWGEWGAFANGADDARDITIEVRHVAGACNVATPWTLTIQGNVRTQETRSY